MLGKKRWLNFAVVYGQGSETGLSAEGTFSDRWIVGTEDETDCSDSDTDHGLLSDWDS